MSTSCSKTLPSMVSEPNWVRSILGCIVHLIPRLTCGERPYTDHAELAAATRLPGNRDRDSGGPRPADADCHDRPGFILTASTTHANLHSRGRPQAPPGPLQRSSPTSEGGAQDVSELGSQEEGSSIKTTTARGLPTPQLPTRPARRPGRAPDCVEGWDEFPLVSGVVRREDCVPFARSRR